MALLHAVLLTLASSRLRRPVDLAKAEAEDRDEAASLETDDWHEDTRQWHDKASSKRQMREFAKIQSGQTPDPNVLQSSGKMVIGVVFLRPHLECPSHPCQNMTDLGRRWVSLLHSGGVQVTLNAVSVRSFVIYDFTQSGQSWAAKDWLILQPEVLKVTVDNVDYWPDGVERIDRASQVKAEQAKLDREAAYRVRERRRRNMSTEEIAAEEERLSRARAKRRKARKRKARGELR